jgi:hypothetical protein
MSCERFDNEEYLAEVLSLSDAPSYTKPKKMVAYYPPQKRSQGNSSIDSYIEENIDPVIIHHDEYWNHKMPCKP